jgi:hypothetical protein
MRAQSADARASGQRVVHMLHVRRTGGTAVQTALRQATAPRDLRLLLHAHGISLADIPAGDEVVLFLRDPVARFVSGFEMRRVEGKPRYYRPWDAAEQRAFTRFGTAQELALALGSRQQTQRDEAERAMRSVAHLRSHFSDWLGTDELVRARQPQIVLVGWQERLQTDFATLVDLLGLPPDTSLPRDDYSANRSNVDPDRRVLSPGAIDIVRAWYADDYRAIGLMQELALTTPPADVRLEE